MLLTSRAVVPPRVVDFLFSGCFHSLDDLPLSPSSPAVFPTSPLVALPVDSSVSPYSE